MMQNTDMHGNLKGQR